MAPALRAGSVLFAIVLLSRLPFLTAGYGLDIDGWLMLEAGRWLSTHGTYQVSRFPGYPIPEAVFSLVWRMDPWVVNGITACLSAAAAVLFRDILRRHGCRFPFLGALGMSCVPVVFVHSVDAMDYLWALTASLAAWRFALRRRFLLSGAFAGLAVGCRLTSGLAWLPLAVLCFDGGKLRAPRCLITLVSAAGGVALLAYLAPFLEYGWSFLDAYPGDVPLAEVLRQAGPGVWGKTGLAALGLSIVGVAVARLRRFPATGRSTEHRVRTLACTVGVLVFGLLFCAMPHDAGYLIPAVPFALVLFARFLLPIGFAGLSLALVLAPFVDVGPDGIGEGPILRDRRERELQVRRVDAILDELELRGETKAAVAAGPLRIPTSFEYALRGPSDTEYVFFNRMSLEQMNQARELGYSVHLVHFDDFDYGPYLDAGATLLAIPHE